MIPILIRFIPHKEQAYDTVGDYGESLTLLKGEKRRRRFTWFAISKMKDWRYELLVVVHELVEWGLVKHAGIKISDIDAFDRDFEKFRTECLTALESDLKAKLISKKGAKETLETLISMEPGNEETAPYYTQHKIATDIEKTLATALDVYWPDYEKAVQSL